MRPYGGFSKIRSHMSGWENNLTCESEFDRLARIDDCVDPP